MHMFCYQCQETGEGRGCRYGGTCGKDDETANFQDLLIWSLKGWALALEAFGEKPNRDAELFLSFALFSTITNVNFDAERMLDLAREAISRKAALLHSQNLDGKARETVSKDSEPSMLTWLPQSESELRRKALQVGVLFCNPDEDLRSLRETIIYGLKGIAAYLYHAMILGHDQPELSLFILKALAETARDRSQNELLDLALETGRQTLKAMALLERANIDVFGQPEPTQVPLFVRENPGILITGHDLLDMEELLAQTEGTGVDVYTHSEMIPAHYYPAFKKFSHLAGNYGNAWWNQDQDFNHFNGPILVTSNCITPVQPSYQKRIFTTGPAAYPGIPHVSVNPETGKKDFKPLIQLAQQCPPPTPIDQGTFLGGFGYAVLDGALEKVAELIRKGRIRRIVVMAGCDGRDPSRDYYREVAEKLPSDAIILTAGCAKYRFMQCQLGSLEGLPRVLDAGQCNDCFALISIAQKLQTLLDVPSLNDLPLSFSIPWYDQKSVAILLALFSLGVQGIRLGPSHPAFFSPTIHALLESSFQLKRISTPQEDVIAMMQENMGTTLSTHEG